MQQNNEHIFLIGMMGSGKTSVGKFLSKHLNIPIIDSDNYIIEKLKMTTEKIFRNYGEKKFRIFENECLEKNLNGKQCIFSMGGGAILNEKNRLIFKNSKNTFLFQCSALTSKSRIKNDDKSMRPLIGKNNLEKKLQAIWLERKKMYKECATYTIITDNKTIENISNEILSILNEN